MRTILDYCAGFLKTEVCDRDFTQPFCSMEWLDSAVLSSVSIMRRFHLGEKTLSESGSPLFMTCRGMGL